MPACILIVVVDMVLLVAEGGRAGWHQKLMVLTQLWLGSWFFCFALSAWEKEREGGVNRLEFQVQVGVQGKGFLLYMNAFRCSPLWLLLLYTAVQGGLGGGGGESCLQLPLSHLN